MSFVCEFDVDDHYDQSSQSTNQAEELNDEMGDDIILVSQVCSNG